MQKNTIENLAKVLSQQLECYENLLTIGNSKNKLLLTRAAEELQELVTKEELIVQTLMDLEIPRKTIVKKLTNDPDAKFDTILDAIESTEDKSKLWIVADKLNSTIEKVNDVNYKNQKLVEQALELTLHSLKLVTGAPKPTTYGPPGKTPAQLPQRRSLINKKA